MVLKNQDKNVYKLENKMEEREKYCRSLHAHISLGTTSDDRFMPKGYIKAFASLPELILTEKLDGQNNCFKTEGVFARSHAAPSILPWDKPLWQRYELMKEDLKSMGIEIFGENMYGIHSIAYSKLESFFYVFAVRKQGVWLSWEEVKMYAELFDFPVVPTIDIKTTLQSIYTDKVDENTILRKWLIDNIGMTWEEYVETPGLLGGYDPKTGLACSEGFVIRNSGDYKTNSGLLNVEFNEFDNLFKLVRSKHVKTDVHWTKTWEPAKLVEYSKYKWDFCNYGN